MLARCSAWACCSGWTGAALWHACTTSRSLVRRWTLYVNLLVHASRCCAPDLYSFASLCTAYSCRRHDVNRPTGSYARLCLQPFSCQLAASAILGCEYDLSRCSAAGGDNKISRCIWAAGYAMTDPGVDLQPVTDVGLASCSRTTAAADLPLQVAFGLVKSFIICGDRCSFCRMC